MTSTFLILIVPCFIQRRPVYFYLQTRTLHTAFPYNLAMTTISILISYLHSFLFSSLSPSSFYPMFLNSIFLPVLFLKEHSTSY